MSMIGHFIEVTPDQLHRFRFSRDMDWLQRALECDQDDPGGGPDAPISQMDVDKAWHGIHFTLTGEVDSASGAEGFILGGEEVGGDLGYGPARVLRPEEVIAVSEAISAIPPEVFESRVSCGSLEAAQIYPNIWDEGEEAVEYLVEYYKMLSEWIHGVAERGNGVVLLLT